MLKEFRDTVHFNLEDGIDDDRAKRAIEQINSIKDVYLAVAVDGDYQYRALLRGSANASAVGCQVANTEGVQTTCITPAAHHELVSKLNQKPGGLT